MKHLNMSKKIGVALCGILVVYALFSMAYSEDSVTGVIETDVIETGVKVVPQVISLNSQNTGTQQNIKANLGFITLYRDIGEPDISFIIGDDVVVKADSIIWAWTHMEVSFDRTAIQKYAIANNLVGKNVDVTIKGDFEVYTDAGDLTIYTFTGSDQVLFK